MASEELDILIAAKLGDSLSQLEAINQKLEGMGKTAKEAKEHGDNLFEKLKGGFEEFIGLEVVKKLAEGFKEAFEAGTKFLKLNEEFNQVFGSVAEKAGKVRTELVDAFHLSEEDATKLLKTTGDLTQGLGDTAAQSLEVAGGAAKISKELEEFGKGNVTSNVETLNRAFVGNTRALRELGVKYTEQQLLQDAQTKGIVEADGSVSAYNRQLLILAAVTDQNKNATDSFNSGVRSTEENMKIVSTAAQNFKVAFGVELVKALEGSSSEIGNFVEKFGKFENLQLVAVKFIEYVKLGFGLVKAQFEVAALPITVLIEEFIRLGKNGTNVVTTLATTVKDYFAAIGTSAAGLGKLIVAAFTFNPEKIKLAFKELLGDVEKVGQTIAAGAVKNAEALAKLVPVTAIKAAFNSVEDAAKKFDDLLHKNAVTKLNEGKENAGKEKDIIIKDKELTFAQLEKLQKAYDKLVATKASARIAQIKADEAELLDVYKDSSNRRTEIQEAASAAILAIQTAEVGESLNKISGFTNTLSAGVTAFSSLAKTITDQQVASGKISAEEQKKILHDTAIVQKGIAIATATIDTASAITKTLGSIPFPASIPFIVAAGILGGLQIATIAATPIPGFAKGTDYAPGGPALVGEGGEPEIVNLKRGDTVTPLSKVAAALGFGSNGSVTNNSQSHSSVNNSKVYNISVKADNPVEMVKKIQRTYGPGFFG